MSQTSNSVQITPTSGRGTLNGQFRSEIDLSMNYDQSINYSTPRKNNRTPEPGVIPANRQSSLKNSGKVDIYAKFVYIFAALAESDFEHEYLYALRLVKKSFQMISLKDDGNRRILDKIYSAV